LAALSCEGLQFRCQGAIQSAYVTTSVHTFLIFLPSSALIEAYSFLFPLFWTSGVFLSLPNFVSVSDYLSSTVQREKKKITAEKKSKAIF
jgi:hypothetical protein